MISKSRIALAAGMAAAIGLAAFGAGMAQEAGGGHMMMRGGGHHGTGGHHGGYGRHAERHLEMMETFDGNGDGKLTQDEVDRTRAERMKRFDANGDGTLDLEEYQALWLDAMRERMVDRFQAHDADGDGKVTTEEFGRGYARFVKRMDLNGDGVLDDRDMELHDRDGRPGEGSGHGHGSMHGGN